MITKSPHVTFTFQGSSHLRLLAVTHPQTQSNQKRYSQFFVEMTARHPRLEVLICDDFGDAITALCEKPLKK